MEAVLETLESTDPRLVYAGTRNCAALPLGNGRLAVFRRKKNNGELSYEEWNNRNYKVVYQPVPGPLTERVYALLNRQK